MKEFTMLYKKANGGQVVQWQVNVHDQDGKGVIEKIHGQVGGALQNQKKVVATGKNVGRANETTPYEQALSEAESAWKKQMDKGYVEDPSGESSLILPMSCQTFQKSGHRIEWPAVAMAKLNGVRSFNEQNGDGVSFHSKVKKGFYNATLKHLSPVLQKILYRGIIGDGEAYVHGWTLQEINRAIKKYRPGTSEQLQFWLFCIVDLENMQRTFRDRFGETLKMVQALSPEERQMVRIAPWQIVNNEKEMKAYHDHCVDNGFEGVCVYNFNGVYEPNHRSALVQKYKEFIDHEFEIIGGRPAEGTQEGCVIFRVRGEAIDDKREGTGKVVEFDVVPKGSLEWRRFVMRNIDEYIGKPLTVRYHELSEDGVPVPNPVGVAIRDYE